MKTKMNVNRILVLMLLSLSMIGMQACNSVSQKEGKETHQTAKPSMDLPAAAFMGDVNAIKAHIAIGTDLNQKDQYGSTPLIIATTFNKIEAAQALIDGGADLNLKSADGSTALHTAAFFCRVEIAQYLLQKGADKTLKNSFGSTPVESVSGSFEDVKAIYEQLNRDLGPLGLRLDLNYLEATRPKMVVLLQK
ncbi:ankyrin repeat domain-containing protein [Carboxylicivirga linearis]|uniref:Ankyrin repeat domain-containing protein n=1 Tax=Carboxylicivirga linearis TaxID=1628157 RepID=A0ABS5JRY0_9BACT|nr:ankyrin repeat domain-containing protein [Carboxylicivirga linearis]MBS2097624.1 ankyrin repeat domain-containing protein [Carboxylicivirga linearis]